MSYEGKVTLPDGRVVEHLRAELVEDRGEKALLREHVAIDGELTSLLVEIDVPRPALADQGEKP